MAVARMGVLGNSVVEGRGVQASRCSALNGIAMTARAFSRGRGPFDRLSALRLAAPLLAQDETRWGVGESHHPFATNAKGWEATILSWDRVERPTPANSAGVGHPGCGV